MQVSDNQAHYFISYAVAFLVFGCIANWYLWPAIKDRAPKAATIYTIAKAGAMLIVGQKGTKEIAALPAGSGCE